MAVRRMVLDEGIRIDGRDVASHGSREMPVWGDAFRAPPDRRSGKPSSIQRRTIPSTRQRRSDSHRHRALWRSRAPQLETRHCLPRSHPRAGRLLVRAEGSGRVNRTELGRDLKGDLPGDPEARDGYRDRDGRGRSATGAAPRAPDRLSLGASRPLLSDRRGGRVVRQRPAKPRTPVRFWSAPLSP